MESNMRADGPHGRPNGQTGLRILIVEDDADTADSMAILLRLYAHDVRVARDGAAALGAVMGGFILTVQYFVILPPFAWLAKRAERRESPGWAPVSPQPNRPLQRQY